MILKNMADSLNLEERLKSVTSAKSLLEFYACISQNGNHLVTGNKVMTVHRGSNFSFVDWYYIVFNPRSKNTKRTNNNKVVLVPLQVGCSDWEGPGEEPGHFAASGPRYWFEEKEFLLVLRGVNSLFSARALIPKYKPCASYSPVVLERLDSGGYRVLTQREVFPNSR